MGALLKSEWLQKKKEIHAKRTALQAHKLKEKTGDIQSVNTHTSTKANATVGQGCSGDAHPLSAPTSAHTHTHAHAVDVQVVNDNAPQQTRKRRRDEEHPHTHTQVEADPIRADGEAVQDEKKRRLNTHTSTQVTHPDTKDDESESESAYLTRVQKNRQVVHISGFSLPQTKTSIRHYVEHAGIVSHTYTQKYTHYVKDTHRLIHSNQRAQKLERR